MDFGNITTAAQDLVTKAQGMMNSNPDLLNKAESMTGMDLNQDGSTGGVAATFSANDDVMDTQSVTSLDEMVEKSTSDEAVTTEGGIMHEVTLEMSDDEVVE